MNRIDKKFKELRKRKKKAFIVYITAGDPSLTTTKRLILELDKKGVDLIELGIPFSDPLADGPTIQAASQRALSKGVNIKSILRLVKGVRRKVEIPFVFMTYYNLIFQYGLEKFVIDAKKSGVDGVIVPDLPAEESQTLLKVAKRRNFSLVLLAAPTSTNNRLKTIAGKSDGFIYYVSLTGVTGARSRLAGDLYKNIRRLKRFTIKPVCVGFGVSNPRQAKKICSIADGVIVGSAIIRLIEKNLGKKNLVEKIGRFVGSIAKGIKR